MEAVTDLAPILDGLTQIAMLQLVQCGILIGCVVALILAVMFR